VIEGQISYYGFFPFLDYVTPEFIGELPSGGLSGGIASEANGPASRSFAVQPVSAYADESLYSTTPYGRRLLPLMRYASALSGVTSNGCAGGWCG